MRRSDVFDPAMGDRAGGARAAAADRCSVMPHVEERPTRPAVLDAAADLSLIANRTTLHSNGHIVTAFVQDWICVAPTRHVSFNSRIRPCPLLLALRRKYPFI